jgi:hypothetical protein
MGKIGVSQTVGKIVGPLIAAVLVSHGDFSLTFCCSFAMSLAAAFLVLFGVKAERSHGSSSDPRVSPDSNGSLKRNLAGAYLSYVVRTSFVGNCGFLLRHTREYDSPNA